MGRVFENCGYEHYPSNGWGSVHVSDNCPELVCTLLRPVCLGNDM